MSWRRLWDEQLRENIVKRSEIVREIRDFFDSDGFVEVQTPRLVRLAGQEPYLDPMKVQVRDASGGVYDGYLITSPEYACKKLLAAGFEKIYDLGSCFRDKEQFGGLHNPEFTMLEWYRAGADYSALMDDIDGLLVRFDVGPCERLSMDECFNKYCDASIFYLLDEGEFKSWARERGYDVSNDARYEDVFYRVFLNEIEPKLGIKRPTIVYGYPPQMASLARIGDDGLAERCELYMNGVEIANGFSELVDGDEQRRRLEEERQLRGELGRQVYDVDDDFIDAVGNMPQATGIALGVDRLVMVLLGLKTVEDVLVFPASDLF